MAKIIRVADLEASKAAIEEGGGRFEPLRACARERGHAKRRRPKGGRRKCRTTRGKYIAKLHP